MINLYSKISDVDNDYYLILSNNKFIIRYCNVITGEIKEIERSKWNLTMKPTLKKEKKYFWRERFINKIVKNV